MSRKTLSCLLANNCNQKFDTSFVQTTFLPLNFGEILEILFLTQSYSMDTILEISKQTSVARLRESNISPKYSQKLENFPSKFPIYKPVLNWLLTNSTLVQSLFRTNSIPKLENYNILIQFIFCQTLKNLDSQVFKTNCYIIYDKNQTFPIFLNFPLKRLHLGNFLIP